MKKYKRTDENVFIETIRLPDGRTFDTNDLLSRKRKNYKSITIKNTAAPYHLKQQKADPMDKHRRIVQMTVEEIANEFKVQKKAAWARLFYSRKVLGLNLESTKK